MNAIQQAERAGVESLVDENLRPTPEQRALQHQAALNLALDIERVGQLLREGELNAS
jgi:hypothetical protein